MNTSRVAPLIKQTNKKNATKNVHIKTSNKRTGVVAQMVTQQSQESNATSIRFSMVSLGSSFYQQRLA